MKKKKKNFLYLIILLLILECIILLFSEIRLGGSIYNFNNKIEIWYLWIFGIVFWLFYQLTQKSKPKEKVLFFIIIVIYVFINFIGYLL